MWEIFKLAHSHIGKVDIFKKEVKGVSAKDNKKKSAEHI
jgi:hypothetical protein